ncbi:MAG: porin [Oceanospirillaceae bacterium]|nr:porin [Oceanospirillaceae bacterium]MCP5335906.1 porin [Oceanospirillaceae bacterium]MCP5351057.1 porin [Oceanospirillaceae bacterium]
MKKSLTVVSLLASSMVMAAPSNEELQAQIDQLRAQLEATTTAVENQAALTSPVKVGGYGEMHYANSQEKGGEDTMDFHRFVLFFGKEIDAKTRFFSELEVEHVVASSDDGDSGEVELEQAYIEHDLSDALKTKIGMFLVPVGILNETHEPDTFYGVERNNVEKNIIPATWWEGGVALNGRSGMLTWDVAYHSGLNLDIAGGDYKIRDGRQQVMEAEANNFAYTARINVTPLAGVTLGAAVQYQEDVAQGAGIDAQLIEAHAVVQQGAFGLRALYAEWSLNNKINAVEAGADKQNGFYIEPSYKISDKLGVFGRYSSWDNLAGNSADSALIEQSFGANYWLAETVVLKADYVRTEDTSASSDAIADTLNLGMGYSF